MQTLRPWKVCCKSSWEETAVEREFGKNRIPTICLDHCLMGTAEDEKTASGTLVVVVYDSDTEALYVIAV